MKKILITGGNGFVGHHIIEHILKNTNWYIINIDKLSYSSDGFNRIKDILAYDSKRVLNFYSDLTIPLSDGTKKEIGKIDYILNIASESHVDNSITNPVSFIQNNINLMLNILEYAREVKPERFIHFSSDEVYGTADDIDYKEGDRFNPGNPYSASKAAQECICYAYSNTYKLPIQITNCMNILGERQHKEKFLPLCINSIINDNELYIHSNPEKTKAGSRFYIHARNVADAILFILKNVNETLNHIDASKGKFHIVGEKEIDNLELAKLIEKYVRMIPKYKNHTLKYEMVDFHSSRPGHDLRYAMSGEKMKSLGWSPPNTIEKSIQNIINWSLKDENIKWLK